MNRFAACALTAALCMVSNLGCAHSFCVANAAQLQQALTDVSNGGIYNGEDNQINLIEGAYLTTGEAFHQYSTAAHSLSLTGGYTDALCTYALKRVKPLATRLDGHGATGVLSISNANGYAAVRALTIQNGDSGLGAGLQINYLASPNGTVALSQLIIRNNHSSASAGGLYITAASNGVYMNNTLIVNNSADNLYGAGYITAYSEYSFIINNTVSRNTSAVASNPVGGLYLGGTSNYAVYKNIFWNNTGAGLYIGNNTTQLVEDCYGTIGGTPPTGDNSPISQNPSFVDANNNNFRLAGDSPLIAYAQFLPDSGVDLDGNSPPTHGRMDLGAYYETIYIDSFDD
jgi:hypothetical protein